MQLGLFEIVFGIAFSIFSLFVFCYLMASSDEGRKKREEQEWARIEGVSKDPSKKKHPYARSSSRAAYVPFAHRIPKKPISGVAHSITAVKKTPQMKQVLSKFFEVVNLSVTECGLRLKS